MNAMANPMNTQTIKVAMLSKFRGSKRLFSRPFELVEPTVKRCTWYTNILSPLYNAFRLPAKCNEMVLAGISRLLFRCSPAAVFKTIVSVTIYPLNGGVPARVAADMLFIRPIHITLKLLKRLPVTLYTLSVIQVRDLCIWISASIEYAHIDVVKRCVGKSMSIRALSGGFRIQASTRLRERSFKGTSIDELNCPAGTYAFPHNLPSSSFATVFNNCPPFKLFTSDIFLHLFSPLTTTRLTRRWPREGVRLINSTTLPHFPRAAMKGCVQPMYA